MVQGNLTPSRTKSICSKLSCIKEVFVYIQCHTTYPTYVGLGSHTLQPEYHKSRQVIKEEFFPVIIFLCTLLTSLKEFSLQIPKKQTKRQRSFGNSIFHPKPQPSFGNSIFQQEVSCVLRPLSPCTFFSPKTLTTKNS